MAPRVEVFHPSQLERYVQRQPDGKLQKSPVNLKECKLKELLQYNCELNGPKRDPQSVVICEPVLRLFRQCANGMTVETTHWEGIYDRKDEGDRSHSST